ncbi:MAG: tRNA dihydrouridine(20/20a) synthase DusA, partial [Thermosynechococcaceae cyanobacterium]
MVKPFAFQPISVAPMMDRTDRHFRYFMRQITRRTLLYTEMVTSAAILHGDRNHLLGFSPEEKPLSLQVGGDQPQDLAQCARIAEEMGYDEINLNVGCPSSRVQSGHFGACLMMQPERVADCVAAMGAVTKLPVTVKHRIGVDECDRYEDMANFVQVVAAAGCQRFTVHARKAWLQGLSPKENRDVPPLR